MLWALLLAFLFGTGLGLNLTGTPVPIHWGNGRDLPSATAQQGAAPARTEARTGFAICGGERVDDCAIDGDTFIYSGRHIRIAGMDAPETHPAHCEAEAAAGFRATARLAELLDEAGVVIEPHDPPFDRYGRELHDVRSNGRDVAAVMIGEGLARPMPRKPWC